MSKLSKKNEQKISEFFRDFILSFKEVFVENFGADAMQNLEIKFKGVQFLKNAIGLENSNYFVTKRMYKVRDENTQMYVLYPEQLIAALSDIAMGGSGEVKPSGKITELQINSCIDSFNDCYRVAKTFFVTNYKEPLEESGIENIYHGTPQYETIFENNDFAAIYSAKFSQNTVLDVPILFKYEEIENLLIKLRVLESKNIDIIASLEIPLEVELGRTKLPLSQVLKFDSGSLIELDKQEGDSVDIISKNTKVAEGQIVAIGEHFGVRITKIMRKDGFTEDDS